LALADLKLIEPLLIIQGTLPRSGESDKVGEMYRSCVELFEMARIAVESSNLTGIDWDRRGTGRQSEGSESVEDFLRRMENEAREMM
jgi:hypothetical protein